MKNSNKLFNGDHIDDGMDNVTQRRLLEEFEDTKEVIRIVYRRRTDNAMAKRKSTMQTVRASN
jgi:hypothetical protein